MTRPFETHEKFEPLQKGFRPIIGQDVLYQENTYRVQDTNHLSLAARIGIPDANGIVWDTVTISYSELENP